MEKDIFDDDKMSIIGYAQADFKTLITANKLYIDRTAFIRQMENHSNTNLLFVRPRRFGKSLWISILHYYYAVDHKDKFDTPFRASGDWSATNTASEYVSDFEATICGY